MCARGVDRPVARLTAWALATTDTRDAATDRHPPLADGPAQPLPGWVEGVGGYFDSVRWRWWSTAPTGSVRCWI